MKKVHADAESLLIFEYLMDYKNYFDQYAKSISALISTVNSDLINQSIRIINKKIDSKNTIYLIGNGGSSSIASHVSVDFIKSVGIKSQTFNNSNIITCFANDYGHDQWMKESIKSYCDINDLIILISSSGESKNIINAALYCKENKIDLITLSGFSKNNTLSSLGKINFHVESKIYNHVEMTHHIILVSIVDALAKINFD